MATCTLTKNSPMTATGAHISITGHITRDELIGHPNDTEAENCFADCLLWLCVKRSKLLAEGGSLNQDILVLLAQFVRDALGIRTRHPGIGSERWVRTVADAR